MTPARAAFDALALLPKFPASDEQRYRQIARAVEGALIRAQATPSLITAHTLSALAEVAIEDAKAEQNRDRANALVDLSRKLMSLAIAQLSQSEIAA